MALGVTGEDDHSGADVILTNDNRLDTSSINSMAAKITYHIENIDESYYVKKWLECKVIWGQDGDDKLEHSVTSPKFLDSDERWDNPVKWMDDRE